MPCLRAIFHALTLLVCYHKLTYTVEANAGLVASTLNTFQLHACDGQNIEMKCPRNTIISIQYAQYGRQVPSYQMCPAESSNYQNIVEVTEEDTNCLAPTSLQVLLDLCQDKRMCHISASTATFLQDPCPTTSKYLEVAYKCRPNEFQTKSVCQGEQLVLWCKRSTRIVIYTASFGRTAEGNSNCPDVDFSDKECQSKAAVSVALSECQGRKQCVLEAEHHMFGNPCRPGTQKYLTVVFTCVPRKLLKEKVRNPGKKRYGTGRRRHNGHINGQASFLPKASTFVYESPVTTTTTTEPPDQADDSIYRIKGGNSAQPTTATTEDSKEETVPCHNTTVVISESIQNSDKAIGVFSNWLGALLYIKKHKEKAILYFSLGISLGIIGLLTLIIIKLLIQRKRHSHAKLDLTEPTHSRHVSPNRDASSIEREDSDQDVIEVVRFSPRETLRPSNAGPRSLNNSYYG